MSWEIEFEERDTYLFVRVTGENSPEAVLNYTEAMLRHCQETGYNRVLIHERLRGPRLSIVELFGLLAEGSRRAMGKLQAIAYVDEDMGATAEFAENVAVNRGMPMATFDNVDAAKAWLAETTRDDS